MKKILVIDDQAQILKTIRYILRKTGEIRTTDNGKEGLELVRSFQPDLIILDMHMPNLDGYNVARTLREDGYSGIIAALTASTQKSTCDKCISAGCDCYIPKPFDPSDLVKRIGDLMKK